MGTANRTANRTVATLAIAFLLVAGLVPASGGLFCGPASECGPCGQLPPDARLVAACCCCGDLTAPQADAPDTAERSTEADLRGTASAQSSTNSQPWAATRPTGVSHLSRAPETPPGRIPLFQLHQSFLI